MASFTQENPIFTALDYRRALEALRNGVPNREAVKILGCNQPEAERKFADQLARVPNADGALGMLVSGDFGVGKSHLLVHLEDQALSQGFVCSRLAISKETPLYDLGKVFKSAMDNARMPDRSGRLIEEIGLSLNRNRDELEYANFFHWANDPGAVRLSQMFPASLLVHEKAGDGELNTEIEYFWAGDPLKVSKVKDGLKQIHQQQSFSFRAPRVAELPPQRLRFATELIKSAGYKGWVVLLDEIELVGSYSILQRGRSYAEVARWLGQTPGETYPGLVTIGAVTVDFASKFISPDGEKKDHDYVRPKLETSRYSDIAARAETGMRLLEEAGRTPLNDEPSGADVNATVEKLRTMYRKAYGWNAPPLQARVDGVRDQARMRYKVRAAINEWDLLRLYPSSRPETMSDEFHYTYEENPDLERESKDDDDSQPPTTVD